MVRIPKQTFFNLDVEKRNLIVRSALEEFSTKTYNEASVNSIVEKSGISKGSLYQYFQDKKDIYLYLIEISAQVKLDFLQKHEPNAGFDNFFEEFTTLMIQGSEFSLCNPLHNKLLNSALNGPLVDESLQKMKEMSHQYIVHLLENAINGQQIRNDVDRDLMVFFLNSLTTEFVKYIAAKAKIDYFGEIYQPQNMDSVKKLNLPVIIKELMKLVKDGISPVEQ